MPRTHQEYPIIQDRVFFILILLFLLILFLKVWEGQTFVRRRLPSVFCWFCFFLYWFFNCFLSDIDPSSCPSSHHLHHHCHHLHQLHHCKQQVLSPWRNQIPRAAGTKQWPCAQQIQDTKKFNALKISTAIQVTLEQNCYIYIYT